MENEIFKIIKKNNIDLLETFLRKNDDYDLNLTNENDETPLSIAINNDYDIEIIELLLDNGANPNIIINENGDTPLIYSCINGIQELFELLLEKKCDVNLQNNEGNTALLISMGNMDDDFINTLLLSYNANPNIRNNNGESALSLAIINLDITNIRLLLLKSKIKLDLNSSNIEGDTDLTLLIENISNDIENKDNYIRDLGILLLNGANPNIHNDKKIPLIIACSNNYLYAVELLLKYNAKINVYNENKETPLIVASKNNHTDIVKILLKNKAILKKKDIYGNTALFYAEENNNQEIIDLLVKKGAKITIQNKEERLELMHRNLSNQSESVISSYSGYNRVKSPNFDQKNYKICWAYANGRIIFRYIFRAIKLGYCNSIINIGKRYFYEDDFCNRIINQYKESTIDNFYQFIERNLTTEYLELLFDETYTDNEIDIFLKDDIFSCSTFQLRQTVILIYIICFLVGLGCNFDTNFNNCDKGNNLKIIEIFFEYIREQRYYEEENNTKIITFMSQFGFTENVINTIFDFLSNLQIDIYYTKSENPREKPEDNTIKFLYYAENNYNTLVEKIELGKLFELANGDTIDNDIYIIKNIFKEAKKAGVYVGINFEYTEDLISNISSTHACHSIYAIPIDNEKFMIKNSWGNEYTNIILRFEDLRNYHNVHFYLFYFNYQNKKRKTRKKASFSKKYEISKILSEKISKKNKTHKLRFINTI